MDKPSPKGRRLDEATERTLMAAIESYMDTGASTVRCDRCHTPIEFKKVSETVWEHRCVCGKYNGSLRGL